MQRTLIESFEEQVHLSSMRPALGFYEDGTWQTISWKEWWDRAERLAAGLLASEVKPGEPVLLLASTRVEWVIADMAITMVGAVNVPLPENSSSKMVEKVLRAHPIRIGIAENPLHVAKIIESKAGRSLKEILYLDEDVLLSVLGVRGMEYLRVDQLVGTEKMSLESLDMCSAKGRARLAEDSRYVARRRRELKGDDLVTIVYTAGVQGSPRGVRLTQNNLRAQVESLASLQLFSPSDRQLLFMPLAHIFTRVMYLASLGTGMVTAFGRGPETLLEDLQNLKPSVLASVPRVFERIEGELRKKIATQGLRGKFLPFALKVGQQVRRKRQQGFGVGSLLGLEHRVFSNLLFEDLQALLGGSLRFLISGGAPLKLETAQFFFATGIPILEGYGLTESSGVVSLNQPEDFRLQSVGKPIPGVDVTIAEDGEILLRGETIAQSYWINGNEISALDDAGWFHTDDLGFFDSQGFLYLKDRKSELLVTSTGKHISPTPLEEALEASPLVQRAFMVGEDRPYLSVLFLIDSSGLLALLDEKGGGEGQSVRELLHDPILHNELKAHVQLVNREHTEGEEVRSFLVLPEFFSPQDEIFKTTRAGGRREFLKRFQKEIEELYKEEKNF